MLTDDFGLHQLSLVQSRNWSDHRRRLRSAGSALLSCSTGRRIGRRVTYSFHDGRSLPLGALVLVEETVKEAGFLLLVIGVEIPPVVESARGQLARLGVQRLLDGFVGVEAILYDRHGLVTVQKVGVRGVDVTGLHSVHVLRQLRGRTDQTYIRERLTRPCP